MSRFYAFALVLCAAPAVAEAPLLSLPVDCQLGETCFIQKYVDRDPGSGYADFTCGPLSDDGHSGTDFALISHVQMQAGVDVRAAAPGTVLGLRDGMADVIFTAEDEARIDGRDCGNGVLIDHGDGWHTQYCHMKQGSVRVETGQAVDASTVLGQIGFSGRAAFPHLHFTLRKDGEDVDPFRPEASQSCDTDTATALWQDTPAYVPGGLIAAGFAGALPEYEAIKAGTAGTDTLPVTADAVVLWGYVFGGRAGDVMQLDATGPAGFSFSQTVTLERTQAQLFRATGKRRTRPEWPSGPVTGTIRLIRDGIEIDRATATALIGG